MDIYDSLFPVMGFLRVFIIFLLFVLVLFLAGCPVSPVIVGWINGEPVTAAELKFWMQLNRSWVYRYFREKHDLEYDADFWTKSVGNESPLVKLREKALSDIVMVKLEQMEARKYGLINDIGYDAFLRELRAENGRRRKAKEAGEPFFGPEQYTESAYWDYRHSNMVLELRKKILENEANFSRENLMKFYDSEKAREPLFKQPFSEVEKAVQSLLGDAFYRDYFMKKRQTANVRIERRLFDSVFPDQ
ncbi:MAG: hypothetical protein JW969_04900 [Spirochaetales bacterium]|nr:hypothetical protein [Spirochaetales bacterium]